MVVRVKYSLIYNYIASLKRTSDLPRKKKPVVVTTDTNRYEPKETSILAIQ